MIKDNTHTQEDRIVHVAADSEDQDGVEQLRRAGFRVHEPKKDKVAQIQAVQEKLKVDRTGHPAIMFCRDRLVHPPDPDLKEEYRPVEVTDEFLSLSYAEKLKGTRKDDQDTVGDNHGTDGTAYMVMSLERKPSVGSGRVVHGSCYDAEVSGWKTGRSERLEGWKTGTLMNLQQTLHELNKRIFGRDEAAVERSRKRNTRALAGGRVTMQTPFKAQKMYRVAPPERSRSVWQLKNWTEEELLAMHVDEFMKVVTTISPEVNKAYKDFLRNCNESWYYQVEPASATPVIDDFIARLETKHHDFDVLIDRVYAGIYKGGAMFIELILNESADMATDIAVMDPYVARFNRVGEEWLLGQWQNGKWVPLHEDPTTMYVPFNVGPNEPFGRSMMEAAPLDVVRMIGVMNDFRRVLESQGWARADFEIDSERLRDFMPPEIIGDVDAEDEFIEDFINGVNKMYSGLKPNEGYGHLDIVKVNMPKGGQMQSSFFGLVDGLMRLYDRRVGRATGSTPIKQHSNENVAETHAREQRKDYRVDISSIQSTVSGVFSTLLGYVLRAEGKKGEVIFYFENTPDPEDVKALEEAEGVKIANLKSLKELRDMEGIDDKTYEEAVNKYKAEKEKHSAGMRSSTPYRIQTRARGLPDPEAERLCWDPKAVERSESGCGDSGCEVCGTGEGDGERAATISPDGSEQPLPAVPTDFTVTAVFLESAIEDFEDALSDYKNLLNARVTGMTQTDAIETVKKGDWVWNQLTKRYRNSKTKKTVTNNTMIRIRDDYVDEVRNFTKLTDDLINSRITVQEWLLEMRKRVRNANSAEYMLARGGRNAMFQTDLDALAEIIKEQFGFLQQFGEDIRAGNLSASQITARSEMYMEASTRSHEQAKAASYGIELPEYPADGNQICKARCRCRWEINVTADKTEAYWLLNVAAKHCDSCLSNAARWAPYTVETT